MRAEELLDVIAEAQEEYILDAGRPQRKKLPPWIKWVSGIAACLAVLLLGFRFLLPGANSGGGSRGNTLAYMHYTGPVLPLTTVEDADGLLAERHVDFNFSPYISRTETYDNDKTYESYDSHALITDSYTLTNRTNEDISVTALYAFVGSLNEDAFRPAVTVDGAAQTAEIYPGPYSGGFSGAWGSDDVKSGSLNLAPLDEFADYAKLLADGSYQQSAFDEFPVLDQPATVYMLHDYVYTTDEKATNPTLQISFSIDHDKTSVFTYGMNGGLYNTENGYQARHVGGIAYRPNVDAAYQYPDPAYLVVVGEDITQYQLQGYRDGGCDDGEEVDDLSCTVTRYETTLGEFLWDRIQQDWSRETEEESRLLLELTAELMTTNGPLGDNMQRYDDGMLGSMIIEAGNNDRVIYLSFPLTVPAGESVAVEAVMKKDASVDFVGEDLNRNGYDMATELGSDLNFTQQSASISSCDAIEILRQNFGFDLENGITQVTLDLTQPHYWLEVRKLEMVE